ncbi:MULTISPECIES: glutamate ABC transporter substrate-binding protein [unclassified Crossiella]|uniref:glutamate ABC transporter substrate-binding protein n=1 Tax=unclassified Crossiella TaxID=2620835 RepID=UPI00200015EF|nr:MULTISPECIES: glutamate ABC transporter substrate-binding protein [unclassified Crossiella]MCK2240518.1 glutamate ABC transporter substrate-binding protein [Crossiella sp. S99.2]MCK2253031.1 glutamate ABC transporter substrate-binding protein [Crossiella sp. S99.1]
MRFTGILRIGAALAAVALVAACGTAGQGSANGSRSLVVRAEGDKKLTVGIRFDQPGLSLKVTESKFEGFDVDVAKYIAAQLGVQPADITWKEVRAADRENFIKNGTVDFVVATYSINDTRKQAVSFAGPYFVAGQGILVRSNTNDITGPESLNGRKLCSVKDSTSAQQVRQKFAKDAQLVEYFRYSECINALLLNNVDAVTTDDVILAGFAAQNPELLKVIGKPFTQERYGIGLNKDDAEGRTAVNTAIEKMISSGEWKKSIDRNVGPSGYQVPTAPSITER